MDTPQARHARPCCPVQLKVAKTLSFELGFAGCVRTDGRDGVQIQVAISAVGRAELAGAVRAQGLVELRPDAAPREAENVPPAGRQ